MSRGHRLAVVVTAALAALGAACSSGPADDAARASSQPDAAAGTDAAVAVNAAVVRTVDGDTIVADIGGREEHVRLIGIDTPETHKPGTPVECFGREASDHLAELLPAGTPIRLERDAEARDHYERLLAYAVRHDGLFVNVAMARDGFAAQLTVPPNVAHADEFGAAVREARDARRGLWASCGSAHAPAR